jgi:membrane associated rhomboid family serine protease
LIFPLLRGLLWFHRAPLTWLMVALNCAVFAVTFPAYRAADQAIEDLLDDDSFVATNGLLFAATLDGASEPASVRELASRSLEGSEDARILLGHLALRRADFLRSQTVQISKASQDKVGDLVALDHWRQKAIRLLTIQRVHPSYRFGLSDGHSGFSSWFSYQVAHSGFAHLFWNMIFLILFGTFVEHSRGGRAMFVSTWLGGFGGALMYVLLSGLSASPLVGASAAVSALIAISASNTTRRLPFVYWLLPIKGYYGVAWLPAWVLIPAFVLPDLSGYVAAQPGLSAVAYTAHIGGALVGFALSYVFKERPEAFVELAQGVTGTAASSSRLAA